jgi:hypothetical protein
VREIFCSASLRLLPAKARAKRFQSTPIALNERDDFTADFRLTAGPALRLRLNHLNADPDRPRGATLQELMFGQRINAVRQREVPVGDSVEIRNLAPGRHVLNIQSYDADRFTGAPRHTVTQTVAHYQGGGL